MRTLLLNWYEKIIFKLLSIGCMDKELNKTNWKAEMREIQTRIALKRLEHLLYEENPRPMTGFFDTLTDEQKRKILGK